MLPSGSGGSQGRRRAAHPKKADSEQVSIVTFNGLAWSTAREFLEQHKEGKCVVALQESRLSKDSMAMVVNSQSKHGVAGGRCANGMRCSHICTGRWPPLVCRSSAGSPDEHKQWPPKWMQLLRPESARAHWQVRGVVGPCVR